MQQGDDVQETLRNHGKRIDTLEGGFRRHDIFLFGRYNEETNKVEDGIADKLEDLNKFIKDIRDIVKRFAYGFLATAGTAFFGGLWYIVSHWDKIVRLLQ